MCLKNHDQSINEKRTNPQKRKIPKGIALWLKQSNILPQ